MARPQASATNCASFLRIRNRRVILECDAALRSHHGRGVARRQLNGPQARARPLLSSSASPEAITTRVSMPSSTE
jgi:hypothetical protein